MALDKRIKFQISQSNKTRMKCCNCSKCVCVERVLALCANVSKCNWIAQHSQLRGQLTSVVINRFPIVKHWF